MRARPSDAALGLAPDEAAARWLVRIDSGPLSAEDQMAFEAWKRESAANADAFVRAETAWNVFEGTVGDPALDAMRTSALATGREPRRGLWLGLTGGIAASLLVALALNVVPLSFKQGQPPVTVAERGGNVTTPAAGSGHEEFVTAKGERRTIRLADGSTVTLNTDTAIRLGFTANQRLIHLISGQALFEVATNPHRPFVVQAADQQVTALGTIFEVRLDSDRTRVTLVEGKVVVDPLRDVAAAGAVAKPSVLVPGEELVAVSGISPVVAHVDVDQQLSWVEGFVEFRDAPLAEAVREMNRYSSRQIVIADTATGSLRISGLFRIGNPERFAGNVGELLPVRRRALPGGGLELSAAR